MAHSKKPPAAAMAVRRRERRRDERLSVRLRVLMRTDAGDVPLLTENVDRNGLFVRTDAPRPERDLVELVFDTGEAAPLELMCVVRRAVTPDEAVEMGMVAGMALQLYGVIGATRDRWDTFVAAVDAEISGRRAPASRRRRPSRPSLTATTEPGPARPGPEVPRDTPVPEPDSPPPTEPQHPLTDHRGSSQFPFETTPTRPRAALPTSGPETAAIRTSEAPSPSLRPVTPVRGVPRPDHENPGAPRPVAFHIALPSQHKLLAFLTRLQDGRPVTLPSERALPVGQTVHIELVHPNSHETFALPAAVVANLQKDGRPRVSVSFDQVPENWMRQFSDFVMTGDAAAILDLEPVE